MASSVSSRQLAAEFLGTAFLLAVVIGSGIMAERLAGGNMALALWGNTAATGAILCVLILIFGPISGAHFNPAVTLAFVLRREIESSSAALYMVAQILGGLMGMLVAHMMFDESWIQLSTTTRHGVGQWTGEFVATSGLLMTILGCVRYRPEAVPWAVGLFITAGYWFTSSTSFANPAVTIARSFTDTFSGINPTDVPLFMAVQFSAAIMTTVVCDWLFVNDAESQ